MLPLVSHDSAAPLSMNMHKIYPLRVPILALSTSCTCKIDMASQDVPGWSTSSRRFDRWPVCLRHRSCTLPLLKNALRADRIALQTSILFSSLSKAAVSGDRESASSKCSSLSIVVSWLVRLRILLQLRDSLTATLSILVLRVLTGTICSPESHCPR